MRSRQIFPWLGLPALALLAGMALTRAQPQAKPKSDAPAGVLSAADYPRQAGEEDDTARLRRLLADACKLDGLYGPGGATVYLPPGVYTVSDTLELYNVGTLVLRGERMSSRILYTGPAGKPVFDLVQTYRCRVEDLTVFTKTVGTAAAFRVCNRGPKDPPATWTTTTCEWWRVHVASAEGGDYVNAWDLNSTARGGADANNEHHRFHSCTVGNYVNSAWHIKGSNLHGCFWDGCEATGQSHNPPAKWCVDAEYGSYVRWAGGYTNGHSHGVFHLGSFQMLVDINGHNSENETRLVVGEGPTGAPMPITLRNCRCDCTPPADGLVVWVKQPGPLTISGNRFVSLNRNRPGVRVESFAGGSVIFEGNYISAQKAPDPVASALQVSGPFRVRDSRTNVYQKKNNAFVQFGNDPPPGRGG